MEISKLMKKMLNIYHDLSFSKIYRSPNGFTGNVSTGNSDDDGGPDPLGPIIEPHSISNDEERLVQEEPDVKFVVVRDCLFLCMLNGRLLILSINQSHNSSRQMGGTMADGKFDQFERLGCLRRKLL